MLFRFTLYTDHKPLTHALAKAAEPWTARQSRHLSYLAEFTNDIRHISGVDTVVADSLSRPPAGEINAVAPLRCRSTTKQSPRPSESAQKRQPPAS